MKHLKYLQYVIRHKWFVFVYGWQLGVPWLALLHDISKFLPCEWCPYVESFYGDRNGPGVKEAFRGAWNHHQKSNRHHWQYWLLVDTDGSTHVLPMPDRYRREMLADWKGAGRAITGKEDALGWYGKNRDAMTLHPETRTWIDGMLGYRVPARHRPTD